MAALHRTEHAVRLTDHKSAMTAWRPEAQLLFGRGSGLVDR